MTLKLTVTQLKECLMYHALLMRCGSLSVEGISHSLMPSLVMMWTPYKEEAQSVSGDKSMKRESRKR